MRRYKVVRCPRCKTWHITYAEKTFKCRRCGKTYPMSALKIYYSSDNFDTAYHALVSLSVKKKA